MSDSIVLEAQKREVTGKKVKAIRKQGLVPATVYQKGKDPVNVQLSYQPFIKAYAQAGLGQPVELSVDGKARLTMIKDVAIDPVKNTVTHVAFHAVRADRVVEAEIPVVIVGDIPAEAKGNFVVHTNDTVTVKAIPAKLPESFEVSGELLQEAGDSITVADIKVPADVEMISEPELQLTVAEEPRVQEEPEEEEIVDAADVPADNGGDSEDKAEESSSE